MFGSGAILGDVGNGPLSAILFMVLLSSIPLLIVGTTSFLKISVVLGILRNALGAQGIPGAPIVVLLSLVLTLQVMSPVGRKMIGILNGEITSPAAVVKAAAKSGDRKAGEVGSRVRNLLSFVELVQKLAPPIEEFMRRHSDVRERIFFARHSSRYASVSGQPLNAHAEKRGMGENVTPCMLDGEPVQGTEQQTVEASAGEPQAARTGSAPDAHVRCIIRGEGFLTLLPAFVISELRAACALGVAVFLPFMVIDLVVANLLVALGLNMVNPVSISIPLKLFLFAAGDAWFLVCRSLMLSYR